MCRRTFLGGGLAAAVSLSSPPPGTHGAVRRDTVLWAGSGGVRPAVCLLHVGAAEDAVVPAMRALISDWSVHPLPGSSRLPGSGPCPELLVVMADCREPDDLERLAERVDTLRATLGVFVVTTLPGGRRPPARTLRRLLQRCDGVVGVVQSGGLVQATHNLLDGLFVHGFIGYDPRDLLSAMHAGELFALGVGRAPRDRGLDAVDRALLALQRQGLDLSRMSAVHLGVNGDISLQEMHEIYVRVAGRLPGLATISYYATLRDDPDDWVEVSVLAAGPRRQQNRYVARRAAAVDISSRPTCRAAAGVSDGI